ncbi:MAG: hypothetical protein R3348_03620, partial [Xanthomonadales bacterium]|nr:hypothetical protein [Xanthomonadales bacterium]
MPVMPLRLFGAVLFMLALLPARLWASEADSIELLMQQVQSLIENEQGMTDAQRFEALVDISYDYTVLSSPEFATFRGDPRGQDRWTDSSEAGLKRRRAEQDQFLAALQSI